MDARRFLGQEGSVLASVWLDSGNEAGTFSVAAYRLLRPGEQATPVFYRRRLELGHGTVRWRWLVRPGKRPEVRFRMRNPAPTPAPFTVATPVGQMTGAVPAAGETECRIALPAGRVSEVNFEC